MENTRRNSELPNVNGGSSWSLPDVKNPLKILSRSMTSDTLLRNIDHPTTPTSVFNKSKSIDYKEVVEKYLVKTVNDKRMVVRQHSDALIIVQHNDSCDSPDLGTDEDEKPKPISFQAGHAFHEPLSNTTVTSSVSSQTPTSSSRPGTPSLAQLGATNCYKFLESMYIGDISIATNKQLLCKLNVEYILNLCGVDLTSLLLKTKSNMSCSCALPAPHATAQMSLNVNEETSISCLTDYFKEANQFINTARCHGKKVLLFEKEGVKLTGAFVTQYLMQYYKMKYYEAKDFVVQSSAEFVVSSNLDSALRLWETEIINNSPSVSSKPGTPTKDNGRNSRPNSVTRADYKKQGKQIAWT